MINISQIIIYIVLPLIFLLVTFFLYKRYNDAKAKDKKNILKNIDILELSYIYNKKIREKDISATIISLINKGYLKINKNKLIKISNSNIVIEQDIIYSIFKDRQEIDLNRINKLNIINFTLKDIRTKVEIDNIYYEKSLSKKTFVKFIIILMYILIMFKISYDIKSVIQVLLSLFSFIGMKIFIETISNNKKFTKIIGSVVGICLLVGPIILIANNISNIYYLLIYIISLLLVTIMIIFNLLMPKKVAKVEIINQLNILKDYIETKKISSLLEHNND
ncbi:MAG: DUF2207 domain-containing protein, partial [Candidatus Amulumruptor caecigallinarius]|nr:DUF2207 domain-containing protein [Candidatus Amulumruptor caecigallinarius]